MFVSSNKNCGLFFSLRSYFQVHQLIHTFPMTYVRKSWVDFHRGMKCWLWCVARITLENSFNPFNGLQVQHLPWTILGQCWLTLLLMLKRPKLCWISSYSIFYNKLQKIIFHVDTMMTAAAFFWTYPYTFHTCKAHFVSKGSTQEAEHKHSAGV